MWVQFWELIRDRRLFRLLRVRWTGQLTDGIFQSALASFVLFSPERQADALKAALAFAVVLLPYSVVGPFIGTILDRVSRQRAIFYSNLLRALTLIITSALILNGYTGLELTIFVLIAFGVNRLILAGLSAGIPLVTDGKTLISANALAVTAGSIFVVIGGGIGLGLRRLINGLESADNADGLLILAASLGYLLTAFLASRLKRREIGPLPHEIREASFTQGLVEMKEGFKFLRRHSDAALGIIAVALHRGGITALTLVALLLERNFFHNPADSEAGLAGLSLTLSIAAIGFLFGAIIAPPVVNRLGRHSTMKYALAFSALSPIFLAIVRNPFTLAASAFFVALFGQALKVTNDALVQSKIDDYFRGRVFSVYDFIVNGAIVTGALIAALLLPLNGDSSIVPIFVSVTYLAGFLLLSRPPFK